MKPSVRTFPVTAVALSLFLLAPARASAQHTAGGASSVGSAVPAGSSSSGGGGSSSGGDSGSGSQSSSGSGGGESFGRSAIAGHRAANSNPPASPAGLAGGNNQVFTNYSMLSPVPAFGRPRNGLPIVGTAVPRSSVPPANSANGGGPVFIEGAYNPWFYAYDGLAASPFFGVYDPFAFDFGYPIAGGTKTSPAASDSGILHLNIKPRDAEVFIDGALAGRADEFVGLFHKLRVEAGVHRVELRAPGYTPLLVNVRIQPGESITYRGTLEKIEP